MLNTDQVWRNPSARDPIQLYSLPRYRLGQTPILGMWYLPFLILLEPKQPEGTIPSSQSIYDQPNCNRKEINQSERMCRVRSAAL